MNIASKISETGFKPASRITALRSGGPQRNAKIGDPSRIANAIWIDVAASEIVVNE